MSAAALRAWLQANPRAPRAWRELAERATASTDAALWPAGVEAMPLYVTARDALKQASAESSRQTADEEVNALATVGRAIQALRQAIEQAPLPRGSASLYTLAGGGLPDASLLIGWRDVPDKLLLGAYTTSMVDLLAIADELLQQHRDALPVRAVRRHRNRPVAVAFVRWFDFFARQRDLRISAEALASWSEVAAGEPLTVRDVRVILRDAPKELKAPKPPR